MCGHLRVIVDPPLDGAWNMAVDEVLLAGLHVGIPYTLRFYGWIRPTVSLGYLQAWRSGYDAGVAAANGVDLVRRPTGGRAVLHVAELTYALVGPASHGALAGGVLRSYRTLAAGLVRAFRRLGAQVDLERYRSAPGQLHTAICFGSSARYEILAQGRKLAGSAQRRRGGRVLQHGSIPVSAPNPALWRVMGPQAEKAARRTASLHDVLPVCPSRRRLTAVLADELARVLSLKARQGDLTCCERRAAVRAVGRYRNHAYTRGR